MDQLRQMDISGQLGRQDLFCPEGSSGWLDLDAVRRFWDSSASGSLPPPPRKKKHGCLIALLVIVLAFGGIVAAFWLTRTSDLVRVGRSQRLYRETAAAQGGVIVIDRPGHELDGLKLEIPGEAYERDKRVTISARSVENHKLGKDVRAVSPLISIDNGHGFAHEDMLLTIPIDLEPDEFAMGFYYDRKTGRFEGIPFTELEQDSITLLTRHFSDVLVLATNLQTLLDLDVDSGFRPGFDDWQFTNYGSILAPGGHCAGQSVTAMFYYTEIHLARGEPRLYGRFDNNNYGRATSRFWQDDSWGYRYSSLAQHTMAWGSRSSSLLLQLGDVSDTFSLAAFAFAMKLTGEPQFVYIAGTMQRADGTSRTSAHAIIAYRIKDGNIYVADPNFPGQADRTISFDMLGSFQPYGSGDNAAEIEASGVFAYTNVRYIAKSALFDYGKLGEQYRQMLKGEIGDGYFPEYYVEYLQSVDPVSGEENWVELAEDLDLLAEDTEKAGADLRGKLRFKIHNLGTGSQGVTVYSGLDPVQAIASRFTTASGFARTFTLELKPGVSHYAFYFEQRGPHNRYYYNDLLRIQIAYEQQAELELVKPAFTVIARQKAEFRARVKDAPPNPLYRWDFGDGRDPVETDEPIVEYRYEDGGEYTLAVTLIDRQDNKTMAVAEAGVETLDLYGSWSLDYTIEESGMVDMIITQITRIIGRFIAEIFGLDPDEADFEVTMRGVVIGCVLEIHEPAAGQPDSPIRVTLQQQTSSHDFVEPVNDVWDGILTIKDDRIEIRITAEGQPTGFTFKGRLARDLLYGEFDAVIMSGSFQAFR